MSQLPHPVATKLLLWVLTVSIMTSPDHAQTQSPKTPANAQVPLKAVIVLTQEFCGSDSHTGSYWKLGKTIYFTGPVFCRGVEAALKPTFISLTRVSDASLAGDAQVVLVPQFIDVKEKTKGIATSEITLSYEWRANDSSGNPVWVERVEGQARGKKMERVFRDAMNDVFAQSASKMSASEGLRKLAERF